MVKKTLGVLDEMFCILKKEILGLQSAWLTYQAYLESCLKGQASERP